MEKQTLADRVMGIVAGVLQNRLAIAGLPDGLTFEALCLNALDRIYIADALEREWSLEFEEDEIDGWQTLGDIVNSVRNRMS
jgi:acyl carrier protein